jgi:hypothetical protein
MDSGSAAYRRLSSRGTEASDWRRPALHYARNSDLSPTVFQPAIERLLGDIFDGPVIGNRRRFPLRDAPGAFEFAVDQLDAVLATLSAQEQAWVREKYLLWNAPNPSLLDQFGAPSPNVMPKLRHTSRSQALRPLLPNSGEDWASEPD